MNTLLNRRTLLAELMLLNIAISWGLGFPLMKDAMAQHGMWTLLWLRFALAAWLVLPFAVYRARDLNGGVLLAGTVLGVLLFLTFSLLIGVSAIYFRRQYRLFDRAEHAVCAAIGAPGVAQTHARRGEMVGIAGFAGIGRVVAIACGAAGRRRYAGGGGRGIQRLADYRHRLAPHHNAEWLTVVQLLVASALFALMCLPAGQPVWPPVWDAGLWRALLLTAAWATAFAFWVQMRFQDRTTPQRAALIFNLEPLFAALFAWWLLNEHIGAHVWLGGLLIVAAMMVSGLWPVLAGRDGSRA